MDRKLPLTSGEKLILGISLSIDISQPDYAWLDSAEFADFIKAWNSLGEEYATGDNTVISVEIVANYLIWTKRLQVVASTAINKRSDQAFTALNQLEGALFEIGKEASRTLNNL